MSDSYDLLVIGAGTAAMVASMRVRAAGWRVAVVDSRPLGGTCALRGCDPKKMLIGGSSAVNHARRMRGKGVDGDAGVYLDNLNLLPNRKVQIAGHPKLLTLALGYQASDEKPSPSKVLFMTQVHRLRGSLDHFHLRNF